MVKVYLKIFLMTAVVFFLAMFFSNMTTMRLKLALVDAGVRGVLFGIGMSALLGTLHIMRVRKKAGEYDTGDIYSTTQLRELKCRLPYDRVFSLMGHYLKEVAGFTVTLADQEAGRLEARSGLSFASTFGNKVTVTLRKAEEEATEVTITSRPLLFSILADYGESLAIAGEAAAFLRGSEQR